ncbi:hypothetical protein PM082_003236 [Marasmius tenuissimus]|nr:hypothetical protein PM082_003236 [Marasmius tenuissimus]
MTSPGPSATFNIVSTSPTRPTSTATSTTRSYPFRESLEGKRIARPKESQFVVKHGQRLHSFDPEKAPYPLSYDRYVLELEALDNRFVKHLRNGSMSFLNLTNAEKPSRCLDLGCGTGTWVVDTAKEWSECEFVGFDLMHIQIPKDMIESSIAKRIRWVHGNFLTTKLPFEDDEFDHVHVQSIASGVPENKVSHNSRYIARPCLTCDFQWDVLFDVRNTLLRKQSESQLYF